MLSMEPVERSSMQKTSSPRATYASERCEPMKPAPPVMRTRKTFFFPSFKRAVLAFSPARRVRDRHDARERRALVQRSERDHVERRVEVLRVVAQASEFYIIAESERRRLNLKPLAQVPVADDDKAHAALASRAADARRIARV